MPQTAELPTACAGFRHTCELENAPALARWFRERGGIKVWMSADLSDPAKSWTTPNNGPDGRPTGKPSWQSRSEPAAVLSDPAEVGVSGSEEVRRFHVAVRLGANGLKLKCTDASTRKIRAAVAKAGEGAFYVFDYATQEAVILKPKGWTSLAKWMEKVEWVTAKGE